MYISEIQKRLIASIGPTDSATYNRALGLALYNGANPKEITDNYRLALWFEGARRRVKERFLESFNEGNNNLRICSNCGCFMHEGYILGMEYACSEKCAIDLYNGDEEQLRKDIAESMEDGIDDFFWTEW